MNIPGGVRRGLSEQERDDIVQRATGFIEFSRFSLKVFEDFVLGNKEYVDIILNGPYNLKLHSMGLVDENNKVNFYDGRVRVVDTEGKELYKYSPNEYLDYVVEKWMEENEVAIESALKAEAISEYWHLPRWPLQR